MPKANTIKKNSLRDTSAKNEKRNSLSKSSGKKPTSKKKKTDNKNFLKDERVILTMGIFLMILALYLVTSFSSYLWNYLRIGVGVDNAGGYFGRKIGNLIICQSFGIGAYAFALWSFVGGFKTTFKDKIKKPYVLIWHSLFWLCWLPVVMSLIFINEPWMVLGGAYGLFVKQIMRNAVGTPFTIIILIFLLITYMLFGFNIHHVIAEHRSKQQKKKQDGDNKTPDKDSQIKEDIYNTNEFAVDEEEDLPEIKLKQKEEHKEEDIKLQNNDETIEVNGEINLDTPPPQEQKKQKADEDKVLELTVEEVQQEQTVKNADKLQKHQGIESSYDPRLDLKDFKFPSVDFLIDYGGGVVSINKQELEENKNKIVKTLNNYAIKIDTIKATVGPTITLYEIVPAPGIRISKIKNLEDDIALSLSALGIRIIAPIPGKGTIGIEVPNRKPQIVSMLSIINSTKFQDNKFELPIGLGKTIANESFVADLTKMPHLLIAGATGQGKSVGLNAILTSLLYKKHPSELKLILVDPKKVELTLFNRIERHYLAKLPDSEEAIITDTRKVVRTLNSLIIEMENRYNLLKDAQVRNIKEYNAKFIKRKLNPNEGHHYLPYIVLVVDEFADLIMTAGKEIEAPITRLAQLARAIGIHLIIATQRPSVNIITGTIKANFPARIAFRVVSKMDSRTILDTGGADQLVGRGDMLLSTGSDLIRMQCAFVDTPEVEEITDFIGTQRGYPEAYALPEVPDEETESVPEFNSAERDPLFEDAAQVIVSNQHGSTSLLQRKLKLGYNRAGRLIDQLEAAGIVGPFEGSKAREVRVGSEMALEQFLKDLYAREGNKNDQDMMI